MRYAIKFVAITAVGFGSLAYADHGIEGASGGVEVINNCQKNVYLRSVGDKDGPESLLPPGGYWSEQYKEKDDGGGPAIKIRTEGTDILQFEYTAYPSKIWFNLSYVNCWNQKIHSGERCPFWNESFVVESPGDNYNIPCRTGATCNYVYRCPLDDRGLGTSTIAGGPVVNVADTTQNLKLHLCPCEDDASSDACKLAHSIGLPTDKARVAATQHLTTCPGEKETETETGGQQEEGPQSVEPPAEQPECYPWEQPECPYWEQSGYGPAPVPTTLATQYGPPGGYYQQSTASPQPYEGGW